jgi:general secretion pathway protein L
VAVIAAIARTEDVVDRVAMVEEAIGREPEVVGPGALPLATLVSVIPELDPDAMARAALKARPKAKDKVAGLPPAAVAEAEAAAEPVPIGPVAVVDLGETRSEVVFLVAGEPVFVRTISRGTAGLSPTTAAVLARELRQTHAAFRALGQDAPVAVYLAGGGASVTGAEAFLSAELGVPVRRLPPPRIEGVTPEQAERLPHFAKALGLALGVEGGRGMNLRQGALEASRTYPFLREKLPLLSGLAAVIAVSFGFSVVAEMRSLGAERQHLDERLAVVSQEVLGTETRDPAEARELLEAGAGADEDDPLPGADAFDVMVQLSKSVPEGVVHDVAEFDVSRGHAIIHGVVPKETDAQKTAETIADGMRKHACLKDVKIQKVQQFGTDKQKYIMEMDVRCGERKKKDDKKKAGSTSTSSTKSDDAAEEP